MSLKKFLTSTLRTALLSLPSTLTSLPPSILNPEAGGNASTRCGSDGSGNTVNVIMGNQACDLDSMVSAVVLAFLHSGVGGESEHDNVHIPVFNIPRRDLCLRKDALWLFAKVGIDINSIPCIDEINLKGVSDSNNSSLNLHLVDHNSLCPQQSSLGHTVKSILDHHRDEALYKHVEKKDIDIQMVGSTCTLVAKRITQNFQAASVDLEVAILLLAAIVIDTHNLNSSKVNFLPVDAEAVSFLSRFSDLSPSDLYFHLSHERSDLSGLLLPELMRKDVKYGVGIAGNDQISDKSVRINYAISTIPGVSIEDVLLKHLQKGESGAAFKEDETTPHLFRTHLSAHMKENELKLCGMMLAFADTSSGESAFSRELVLVGYDEELLNGLEHYLMDSISLVRLYPPSLVNEAIRPVQDKGSLHVRCYQQKAVKASRKKVMPLFQEFMQRFATSQL